MFEEKFSMIYEYIPVYTYIIMYIVEYDRLQLSRRVGRKHVVLLLPVVHQTIQDVIYKIYIYINECILPIT